MSRRICECILTPARSTRCHTLFHDTSLFRSRIRSNYLTLGCNSLFHVSIRIAELRGQSNNAGEIFPEFIFQRRSRKVTAVRSAVNLVARRSAGDEFAAWLRPTSTGEPVS